MDARDPAPAIGRGFALLDYLALNGPTSLERLCADLGIPKSSGLRLLESLQLNRAVQRDPHSKRYRALLRLGPADHGAAGLQHRAAELAPAVAETEDVILEVYALHSGVPTMVDRFVPEGLQAPDVQARIGFLRELHELDATAQVAFAWGPLTPPDDVWAWTGPHGQRSLPEDEVRRVLQRCRRRGGGVDLAPNPQHVRR
ncbi:MAG: helix-turn-helix domain-containing protein, partial [Planctomycetota bacterium]